VEPLAGVDRMRADRLALTERRKASRTPEGREAARGRLERTPVHRLASGPGKVAAAFGIDTSWTGRDLCSDDGVLRLERDPRDPVDSVGDDTIQTTARIGVGYAGTDWAERPWRFTIAGHRSVSVAAGP
jgi:3-methyladenine DNA glycosylase Mpg